MATALRQDIAALESELMCSVCDQLFTQPTGLPCQHTFCRSCLEDELAAHSTCPVCHMPACPRDMVPNLTLDALLPHVGAITKLLQRPSQIAPFATASSSPDAAAAPGSAEARRRAVCRPARAMSPPSSRPSPGNRSQARAAPPVSPVKRLPSQPSPLKRSQAGCSPLKRSTSRHSPLKRSQVTMSPTKRSLARKRPSPARFDMQADEAASMLMPMSPSCSLADPPTPIVSQLPSMSVSQASDASALLPPHHSKSASVSQQSGTQGRSQGVTCAQHPDMSILPDDNDDQQNEEDEYEQEEEVKESAATQVINQRHCEASASTAAPSVTTTSAPTTVPETLDDFAALADLPAEPSVRETVASAVAAAAFPGNDDDDVDDDDVVGETDASQILRDAPVDDGDSQAAEITDMTLPDVFQDAAEPMGDPAAAAADAAHQKQHPGFQTTPLADVCAVDVDDGRSAHQDDADSLPASPVALGFQVHDSGQHDLDEDEDEDEDKDKDKDKDMDKDMDKDKDKDKDMDKREELITQSPYALQDGSAGAAHSPSLPGVGRATVDAAVLVSARVPSNVPEGEEDNDAAQRSSTPPRKRQRQADLLAYAQPMTLIDNEPADRHLVTPRARRTRRSRGGVAATPSPPAGGRRVTLRDLLSAGLVSADDKLWIHDRSGKILSDGRIRCGPSVFDSVSKFAHHIILMCGPTATERVNPWEAVRLQGVSLHQLRNVFLESLGEQPPAPPPGDNNSDGAGSMRTDGHGDSDNDGISACDSDSDDDAFQQDDAVSLMDDGAGGRRGRAAGRRTRQLRRQTPRKRRLDASKATKQPSAKRRRSSKAPVPLATSSVSGPGAIVFATSGLSKDERKAARAFADLTTATFVPTMTDDVTHVVCHTGDALLAKRTMKYFLAILRGLPILSHRWLLDSNSAGTLLPLHGYHVTGDSKCLGGPLRGRTARETAGAHALLHNVCFFVTGEFTPPSPLKDQIHQLIAEAGGVVVGQTAARRADSPLPGRLTNAAAARAAVSRASVTTYVLVNTDMSESQARAVAARLGCPVLGSNWLVDSICQYERLDIAAYRLA